MIICGLLSYREAYLKNIVDTMLANQCVGRLVIVEADRVSFNELSKLYSSDGRVRISYLPRNKVSRIENIANARCKLLSLMLKDTENFSHILMLDAGRENINFDPNFDLLKKSVNKKQILTASQLDGYYDVFALRKLGEDINARSFVFKQQNILVYTILHFVFIYPIQRYRFIENTKVASAFGGALFCQIETARFLDYSYKNDPNLCEHVSSQFAARESGVEIFISPLLRNGPIYFRISIFEKFLRKLRIRQ